MSNLHRQPNSENHASPLPPCFTGVPCQSTDCCRDPATTRRRIIARGQRLLVADSCSALWVVRDGLAGLCTTLSDGRRQIMHLVAEGDVVCPLARTQGAEVWLEALSPCVLCEFDLVAAKAAGEDCNAMTRNMFHIAHRELQRAFAQLVVLGRLDAMERICLFLADMAWRFGRQTPDGVFLSLPLKREDIADYLGLNAETVSRLLTKLKKARTVELLSRSDYLLRDIEALERKTPITPINRPAASEAHLQ